jgi:hypothetical protein
MNTTIDKDRLAQLDSMVLSSGSHESLEEGACAMELVSYLAHEPWSDSPQCTCPVLGAFMRRWNDGILDDETRTRLLRPLLPRLIGTRSTPEVEDSRAWLATDWLIRVCTPAFLDLSSGLREHARALSGLPPVTSSAAAGSAQPTIAAAGAAAWDAAWAAAGAAAGDDAWAAAGAAARAAARAAAWAAAWAAAGAAARAAARAAAGSAARSALQPVVDRLQVSAVGLVERMIAVEVAS